MSIVSLLLKVFTIGKKVYDGVKKIEKESEVKDEDIVKKHSKKKEEIYSSTKDKFYLRNVNYDSQRDNLIDPLSTCFPTSVKMVIHTIEQFCYGGKNREVYLDENFEDTIIKNLVDNRKDYQEKVYSIVKQKWVWNYLPRNIYAFWEWFINEKLNGFVAEYESMTQERVREYLLFEKRPLIVSTKLTKSGHIIVIRGYDKKGFFCNDPYGKCEKKGEKFVYDKNQSGENVYYTNEMLLKKMNTLKIKNKEN